MTIETEEQEVETGQEGAEGQLPAEQAESGAEGAASEEAEAGAEGTAEAAAEEGKAKPNKTMPEWVEKRFGQLSAKVHKKDEEIATRDREIADLKKAIGDLSSGKVEPKAEGDRQPADVLALATELAEKIAEKKAGAIEFVRACNKVADDGRKKYDDFNDAIAVLNSGYGDVLQQRPEFLQTVTELPNGGDVYYALGKDPAKAEHILSLPAYKMALELGRMSAELGKPVGAHVSGAPAPIKPLNGLAGKKELSLEEADEVPIEQWMKLRDRDLAAKGY